MKTDEVLYEGNKVANGQVYTATAGVAAGEYEPSASRATQVTLATSGTAITALKVGAVELTAEVAAKSLATFILPAGKTFKFSGGGAEVRRTYLAL